MVGFPSLRTSQKKPTRLSSQPVEGHSARFTCLQISLHPIQHYLKCPSECGLHQDPTLASNLEPAVRACSRTTQYTGLFTAEPSLDIAQDSEYRDRTLG